MRWSRQQEVALSRVSDWVSSGQPVFKLGGYAGTGKTTLAREFASGVRGRVCFAAFTGKAAHVLRRSGAPNVSTIHKLIYLPKAQCESKLRKMEEELLTLGAQVPPPEEALKKLRQAIKEEKDNLSRPAWTLNTDSPLNNASLLVVDEYSMVDEQMGSDLLSFGVPVLALGDPGQLPPVAGRCFFGSEPDYMLTEIHRQAEGNPIIQLSRVVREGGHLSPGTYGASRVVTYSSLGREALAQEVLAADQLLVGKNVTRNATNARVRVLLGRGGLLPEPGDRVVCLRNNHQAGLLNGQVWKVRSAPISQGDLLLLDLDGEDGDRVTCLAHPNHFDGTVDKLDYWTRMDAEEFAYGYALTVHKAQGSQWPSVVLLDEWRRPDRQQWLYTAITRASERVTVVQM